MDNTESTLNRTKRKWEHMAQTDISTITSYFQILAQDQLFRGNIPPKQDQIKTPAFQLWNIPNSNRKKTIETKASCTTTIDEGDHSTRKILANIEEHVITNILHKALQRCRLKESRKRRAYKHMRYWECQSVSNTWTCFEFFHLREQ